MKKILTLLFAIVLVIGCYAAPSKTEQVSEATKAFTTMHDDVKDAVSTIHEDAKDIITTVYGDSKDLAVNLYPEVKSAVMAIAKGIGVAAEHLYFVLVKKYVVEGLVQAIPFLLGIILIIIGWIKTEKYFKIYHRIEWHVLYPILLLVSGIVFVSIVNYNTMFMGLINPEYGAINYILEFTKEMVR